VNALATVNPQHERMLAQLDSAKRALAEATHIDDVKDIRDKAESIRAYYQQQRDSFESQNYAAEIKLRAERRLGDLLHETAREPGERDQMLHDATFDKPKLSDLGIERTQSHRWQKIAGLPEDVFEQKIAETLSAGKELTTTALLRVAKDRERQNKLAENETLVQTCEPLTEVTACPTIVMDPPWDWGDEGDCDQFGRARPTYATMSFADLLELELPAEKNAHLYLWITNRSLPKGFELIEQWGFRYITLLTWCKPHFGMGNYFRGSTEHVMFAVKGSLPLLRSDVGTWFEAPRPGKHSSKPEAFYQLVQSCSPGPWLEMFARSERPGWVSWGAEA
jgi:N6-adenosine-specific RNA methylase IME4